MAKNKSKRSSAPTRAGRGLSTPNLTAKTSVLHRPLPPLYPLVTPPQSAPVVLNDDRRFFHPEADDRPALTKWGTLARATLRNRPAIAKAPQQRRAAARFKFRPSQTKAVLAFAEPESVSVCVRRKRRKEVMFAKGRAGRMRMRKPRFTWRSKFSCRR